MGEFKLELVPDDVEVNPRTSPMKGRLAQHNISRLRLSWGPGPEGEKCKTCLHLGFNEMRSGKRFYKCKLGANTGGPATDVKLKWNACGRWEMRGER